MRYFGSETLLLVGQSAGGAASRSNIDKGLGRILVMSGSMQFLVSIALGGQTEKSATLNTVDTISHLVVDWRLLALALWTPMGDANA